MVKLLLPVLLTIATASPALAARPLVIAVVRGNLTVTPSAGASLRGTPGTMVPEDAILELGPTGWAELRLGNDVRLRLAAGTRVGLASTGTAAAQPTLDLERGRMWIEAMGRPVAVVNGGHRGLIPERGSAVIDVSPAGLLLIPRRGVARLRGVRVSPGQLARIAGGERISVQPGGTAIADLVATEARDVLGDPQGLRSFLIERSRSARIGRLDVRSTAQILRLGPEILGADSGPAGAMLEDALRPAPFFDEEVPSKGPNVSVEVEFAGE